MYSRSEYFTQNIIFVSNADLAKSKILAYTCTILMKLACSTGTCPFLVSRRKGKNPVLRNEQVAELEDNKTREQMPQAKLGHDKNALAPGIPA